MRYLLYMSLIVAQSCLYRDWVRMTRSFVLPIISVYKLPHGQFAYSGHVINLPQDVATFCQLFVTITQWTWCHHRQEGRNFQLPPWFSCQESCSSACSSMVGCQQQVLPQHSHQPWSLGNAARGWRSKQCALCITWLHGRRHRIIRDTGWIQWSLWHPPFWLLRPKHDPADDRAGDSEAVCTGTAISSVTSNSTHSFMASQWFSSHQRVQHWGIHVMCLPYIVFNWCCILLSS